MDFGDLIDNGRFDMMVSNITTAYRPGDDISGHQFLAFYAKAPGADGALDFAVSRRWGPSAFYETRRGTAAG